MILGVSVQCAYQAALVCILMHSVSFLYDIITFCFSVMFILQMGHLVIVWWLPHLAHATICMHGKKIRFLLSSTQMVHRDVFSTLSSSCFVYFPFSTIFFCRFEIVSSFCFKSRHFSCITFALCWRLCIISLCILKTTSLSNFRWQIMQYNF